MRTIEVTSKFKQDLKRELKGQHRKTVQTELNAILVLLQNDQPLPAKNVDHPLSGDWKLFRDCHIRPDLILIYQQTGKMTLKLARLGSHSELGL